MGAPLENDFLPKKTKSTSRNQEFSHGSPGKTLRQQKKSYVEEYLSKASKKQNKWRKGDFSTGVREPVKDKLNMTTVSWKKEQEQEIN